jgi:hypothetical protein
LLAPEVDHRKPAPDPAAERLRNLLSYVEQVIKLDERPALSLAEHRLPSGPSLVLHQHDAQGLPGVRHDGADEDGPVWLQVERLKRNEAPPPRRPSSLGSGSRPIPTRRRSSAKPFS